MTYKGQVRQGKIELENAIKLPEGAIVKVELIGAAVTEDLHPDIVRFTGIIPDNVNGEVEYRKTLESKHG